MQKFSLSFFFSTLITRWLFILATSSAVFHIMVWLTDKSLPWKEGSKELGEGDVPLYLRDRCRVWEITAVAKQLTLPPHEGWTRGALVWDKQLCQLSGSTDGRTCFFRSPLKECGCLPGSAKTAWSSIHMAQPNTGCGNWSTNKIIWKRMSDLSWRQLGYTLPVSGL